MNLEDFVGGLLVLFFGILFSLLITALVFNFYHLSTKKYHIYDGGGSVRYTNEYEVRDNCVNFIDQYDYQVEQCNSYRIVNQ